MYYVEADPDPWETIFGTHCTDFTGMRILTKELFHAREVAEEHALTEGEYQDYRWREMNDGHALIRTQDSGADRVHAEIRTLEEADFEME